MSMNLKAHLGAEPRRPMVIQDCVHLVEDVVRSKSGLSGIAIKGAYGTIKRIKKNFVPEVVDGMLDDWLDKIQPYYDAWSDGGDGDLASYLTARSDDVAEDLLTVTDDRAERTSRKTAKKAYAKMRGSAKRNVADAVPELGRVLQQHLAEIESAKPSDA